VTPYPDRRSRQAQEIPTEIETIQDTKETDPSYDRTPRHHSIPRPPHHEKNPTILGNIDVHTFTIRRTEPRRKDTQRTPITPPYSTIPHGSPYDRHTQYGFHTFNTIPIHTIQDTLRCSLLRYFSPSSETYYLLGLRTVESSYSWILSSDLLDLFGLLGA